MVNYGNGFTWNDVYFMPIHWRRFYFKKLVDAKKKEKEDSSLQIPLTLVAVIRDFGKEIVISESN